MGTLFFYRGVRKATVLSKRSFSCVLGFLKEFLPLGFLSYPHEQNGSVVPLADVRWEGRRINDAHLFPIGRNQSFKHVILSLHRKKFNVSECTLICLN